jgi:uncharacterized protein (TIGR02391 family)
MRNEFARFERVARTAYRFSNGRAEAVREEMHPFDQRNVHPTVAVRVRALFDDGHYSQATFEAFKFVDKEVQRHSGLAESGYKLMMSAFAEASPTLRLTPLLTASHRDEQKGYQFVFAGTVMAIRNPRGHEIVVDDPDTCLDHLTIASHLLRRLNEAGFK